MAKFFSPEFFAQFQEALLKDAKWQETSKGIKTSIKLTSTGPDPASYLLKVEDGKTTLGPAEGTAQPEFSLEGPYEAWVKVGKGEMDLQSGVLKGALKFKGSITKILVYRDRFLRIAEVMRTIPVEF